uniref:HTH CENPB-type domain-containing protein n=1 Tax=Glossina palpalis gambiensis TaxID=67801 RepID=A0A1B0AQ76_9MUSC
MPTIRRCCIVGCMSNSRQNPQLQFFQFPKPDNPFYKMWTHACHASLSRILPFKKPVVCALHFHPHCIGGRRLTGSAVPTLKLEVPSNLKAVEQQAMVEEIERSRKCAYINAVVYEWLVRANLNPQLRGSITHGMIKEKAETAKQIIGCDTFTADNRWLNRFRESHLTGFAQKLASNQLKPMGPSLWIPDIVQDLQHLFPPTSAERIESFENVPEQYINYMKQYGEYEEEEEVEGEQKYNEHEQSYQQQQQHQHQQTSHNYYNQPSGYDPYGQQHHHHPGPPTGYNAYHEYYSHQQQQQHHHHQQQHHQHAHHLNNSYGHSYHHTQTSNVPTSHTPPQPQPTLLSHSQTPPLNETSRRASPYPTQSNNVSNPPKRRRTNDTEPNEQSNGANSPPSLNGVRNDQEIEDLTDGPENNGNNDPNHSNNTNTVTSATNSNSNNYQNEDSQNYKVKLPLPATNGSSTPKTTLTNGSNSGSNSPKSTTNEATAHTNGHSSASPTPSTSTQIKELETYAQALEYLKPLEDFALFKENFRAIGLISQLEVILRKGDRSGLPNLAE